MQTGGSQFRLSDPVSYGFVQRDLDWGWRLAPVSRYGAVMAFTAVPYHLDERLYGFAPGVPVEREITAELPPGGAWQRMGVLYEQVAQAVAGWGKPGAVVSGDCTTSLGVLHADARRDRDR